MADRSATINLKYVVDPTQANAALDDIRARIKAISDEASSSIRIGGNAGGSTTRTSASATPPAASTAAATFRTPTLERAIATLTSAIRGLSTTMSGRPATPSSTPSGSSGTSSPWSMKKKLDLLAEKHKMRRLFEGLTKPSQDAIDAGGVEPKGIGGFGRSGGKSGSGRGFNVRALTNPGGASGLNAMFGGGMGGAGMVAGGALLLNYLAGHVASSAANMANAASPRMGVSEAQRYQDFQEALPIIGSTIAAFKKLQYALGGTTETIRNNQVVVARNAVQIQNYSREMTHEDDPQRGNAVRLNMATSRLSGLRATAFDQSTYQGQIAHAEEQRMLPLQQELMIARAEQQAARGNVSAAQGRIGDNEQHLSGLQARRNQEQTRLNQVQGQESTSLNPNPAGVYAASAALLATNREIAATEQQRIRNIQQLRTEVDALGAREQAVGRATVSILREQVQVSRDREVRVGTLASTLGRSGPADRAIAMHAGRTIEAHLTAGGRLEDLPEFLREQARPVMGGRLAALEQQSGAGMAEFTEARSRGWTGETPAQANQSLEQIRTLTREFGDAMRSAEIINVQTQNNTNLRALTLTMDRLTEAIRNMGRTNLRLFDLNFVMQNAATAGGG